MDAEEFNGPLHGS